MTASVTTGRALRYAGGSARGLLHQLLGHGRVDVSVSYAGVKRPLETIYIGPANHRAVLGVKPLGAPHMRQAVIPAMREKMSGSIIDLPSVSARRGGGIFGGPHCSAAETAVLVPTKAIAREPAPAKVRVNAICPGFITTDVTVGNFTPEQDRMILEAFPMGRGGIASAEIIILADAQPPVGHRAVAAPYFAEKDEACVLSVAYALLIGRLTHHDATPRLIGNALVTIGKTIRRTLVQLALRMVVNLPVGLHTPPVGAKLLISSSPLRTREWASLPLRARCCPSAWWLPWRLRSSPAFPQ